MLALLSPAKRLDFDPLERRLKATQPALLEDAEALVERCRELDAADLKRLMKISDKLAALNVERYERFSTPFTKQNAKQAALAFAGDTYRGLQASDLSADDLAYAQKHLGILSGLYGLLRPLDLIQPYRLEMGTRLSTSRGDDLYGFWGSSITGLINRRTQRHADRTVVNLASNEYFKSVEPKELKGGHVTPAFKEVRGGKPKMIALFAKQARGRMASWMVRNRIERRADLVGFDEDGYGYEESLSTETQLVFLREGD